MIHVDNVILRSCVLKYNLKIKSKGNTRSFIAYQSYLIIITIFPILWQFYCHYLPQFYMVVIVI